jgi:hypothetical protein
MEGMGVGIDQAGEDDPAESSSSPTRFRRDRCDLAPGHFEADIGHEAVATQPRQVGNPGLSTTIVGTCRVLL